MADDRSRSNDPRATDRFGSAFRLPLKSKKKKICEPQKANLEINAFDLPTSDYIWTLCLLRSERPRRSKICACDSTYARIQRRNAVPTSGGSPPAKAARSADTQRKVPCYIRKKKPSTTTTQCAQPAADLRRRISKFQIGTPFFIAHVKYLERVQPTAGPRFVRRGMYTLHWHPAACMLHRRRVFSFADAVPR